MTKRLSYASAAVILCTACSGGAQPPPFKPIADNNLLMAAVIEPAADIIWDSVGTIITAEGEENIRPQSDEEWMLVRNAAVTVSESGNLLMMVPRAADGDEWMRLAQAMVDTGAAAIKAADAKNPDQMFDAGAEIYSVCTNCHSKYDPEINQRVQ
jgi:hypothetical protein